MNKYLLYYSLSFSPSASLAVPLPASTGSTSPALIEAQLAKAATLKKTTVRPALILVINKNGTNAIPYLTLARDTISILLSGTNYSQAHYKPV
jgi:hypothetical protein